MAKTSTSKKPALTVVTANVNGIRAAHRRGGLDWLAACGADVVCLQEVRATHEQLHETLADSPLAKWHVVHDPAPQLGRAGVAILSRTPAQASRNAVKHSALDRSGRWLEADFDTALGRVTVVSTYVHAGEVGTARQDEKWLFLDAMHKRLESLRRAATKSGDHVLITGDFNIAHREVDLKNWRANRENSGFLPREREYLDRWFNSSAWIDLGRKFGGDGPGPYTWWSWRGRGFDTDGGWRIDYLMASAGLAELATSVTVAKAPTYAERWSDHAPVIGTFRSA
jgi:exodeoxyribonuclease-3